MAQKRCSAGSWFHKWDTSTGRRVCVYCRQPHYHDRTLAEKFWPKVDKSGPNGCWIWTGALFSDTGRGEFGINGIVHLAHRVSWELTYGPIPESDASKYGTLYVLHKCDNPPCVNPDHLFLGTGKENIHDMIHKGRSGNSNLKPDDVRDIRRRLAEGQGRAEIASYYNVNRLIVDNIAAGRTWASVR